MTKKKSLPETSVRVKSRAVAAIGDSVLYTVGMATAYIWDDIYGGSGMSTVENTHRSNDVRGRDKVTTRTEF